MAAAAAREDGPTQEDASSAQDTPPTPNTDEATGLFVDHRELLFSVVYSMLASVADTEDVLQETWLSWSRRGRKAPLSEIGNPRAYLVRIAVNHGPHPGRRPGIRRLHRHEPCQAHPRAAGQGERGDRDRARGFRNREALMR
jgi:hypothetical protein